MLMGKGLSAACYGSFRIGILREPHNFPLLISHMLILFSKLVTLIALGYRVEAISILGREVMLPRGLIGLGFDSIDLCGPEIAEVSSQYPLINAN